MSKMLYIGAKTDLNPLFKDSEYSDFVFVDSLPRNEYGYPYYYKPFYRTHFKRDVIEKLREKGFEQTSEPVIYTDDFKEINVPDLDSHSVSFYNSSTDKHLQYFFSTGLPYEDYSVFKDKIIPSIQELPNALFVRGHHPHEDTLEMLKKPFHFIGCSPTYFPKDVAEVKEEEKYMYTNYSCMRYIISNKDKNGVDLVHKYTYIDQNGHLYDFTNYDDFYRQYKSQSNDTNENEGR